MFGKWNWLAIETDAEGGVSAAFFENDKLRFAGVEGDVPAVAPVADERKLV